MSENTEAKSLDYLSWPDQRNAPEPHHHHKSHHNHETDPNRFHEGKEGAHNLLDSKDQRSIANTLAAAEKEDKDEHENEKEERVVRPTSIAKSHGNEPSKGAKIDEELQREDEEYLKRKGKA